MDREAWQAIVHGVKELDTAELSLSLVLFIYIYNFAALFPI